MSDFLNSKGLCSKLDSIANSDLGKKLLNPLVHATFIVIIIFLIIILINPAEIGNGMGYVTTKTIIYSFIGVLFINMAYTKMYYYEIKERESVNQFSEIDEERVAGGGETIIPRAETLIYK